MIIYIDDSVFLGHENNNGSDLFYEFVEEVCARRRKGIDFIMAKKSCLLALLGDNNLSILQIATLKKINQDMTSHGEAFLDGKFFVTVYDSKCIARGFSGSDVNIDINDFNVAGSIIPESLLVIENSEDDLIFSKIGRLSLRVNELNHMSLNYRVIHGGGHTMINECNKFLTNNTLTFAICDSDMKTPNCPVGGTARGVYQVFKSKGKLNQFFRIGVHEIENLIPICVLESTARKEQMPAISFLKFCVDNFPEAYLYYDMKEGFLNKQVMDLNGRIGAYWNSIYDAYAKNNNISYKVIEEGMDDEIIFNKLSSMLKAAMRNVPELDCSHMGPDTLHPVWRDIGNTLVKWFLAPSVIRV